MQPAPSISVKLLSGGRAGLIKEFDPDGEVLIGRGADADVRLHPTEDKMVGRSHARLFLLKDTWHIACIHRTGLSVDGRAIEGPTPVRNGSVYMLGRNGPELRVSILGEDVPATLVESISLPDRRHRGERSARRAARQPLRRVEYDPKELQASIKQESRRTLRVIVPIALAIVAVGAVGFAFFVPRQDPLAMSGADVQRAYGDSVFRAVCTVRFRCPHPDIGQNDWRRYWTLQGSAFALGVKDGWVYAITNHHVFGDPSRPDLSTDTRRMNIALHSIFERWPQDWPALAGRLDAFAERHRAADVANIGEKDRVRTERYDYLSPLLDRTEFDQSDPNWRQVIVDGAFIAAEVVEASEQRDTVLFRFRAPSRTVVPLPVRSVTSDDAARIAGDSVYILGFPGAGDLPFNRSADALGSSPDISPGVLSNIKRDDAHQGYSIQVTAPINEGNSGGPLFDARGNVIGINTWGPSKAETEGVSYALAMGSVLEMLRRQDIVATPPHLPE